MKKHYVMVSCLLLLAFNGMANAAELVNSKMLFPVEKIASERRTRPLFSARLNPAGTHLIYPKMVPASPPDYETTFEMMVYEIASSKEKAISVNLPNGYETVYTRFNVFNPMGDQLALGRYQGGQNRQTELVLYNLKHNKVISTGIEGRNLLAMFDHTGHYLYRFGGHGESGNLKIDLSDFTSRRTSIPGWIHTPSPYSQYATVFTEVRRVEQEMPSASLQLWNLETEKMIKELPVHEKNSQLDDVAAQWTRDGRYVYYLDISESEGNDPVLSARVWDAQRNTQKTEVPNAMAVGPGPTKTTMVMVDSDYQSQNGIFLHDAQNNETLEIGPEGAQAIHACGNRLLYVVPGEDQDMVYIADIHVE